MEGGLLCHQRRMRIRRQKGRRCHRSIEVVMAVLGDLAGSKVMKTVLVLAVVKEGEVRYSWNREQGRCW